MTMRTTTTKTRIWTSAVCAVLALGLAGCGHHEDQNASSTEDSSSDGGGQWATGSASSSASASPSATSTQWESAPPQEAPSKGSFGNGPQAPAASPGAPSPVANAQWDSASQAKAKQVAVDAAKAYTRPDVPAEQWRAEMGKYLTAQAKDDFKNFQPQYLKVTGVDTEHVDLVLDPVDTYTVTGKVYLQPGDQVFKILMIRMPDDSFKVQKIEPAVLNTDHG